MLSTHIVKTTIKPIGTQNSLPQLLGTQCHSLDCSKSPSSGATSTQCILISPTLLVLPSFSPQREQQKTNTVITIAFSSNIGQNMFHYSFLQTHRLAWGWHPTINHDYVCSELQMPSCKSSPTENEKTVWMHVSLIHRNKHL